VKNKQLIVDSISQINQLLIGQASTLQRLDATNRSAQCGAPRCLTKH
jgi:hypothetical protein